MNTTIDTSAEKISENLEAMIDSQGMQAVLSAIEEICYGKADHIAENWQDKHGAMNWRKMAKAIEKAWAKAGDLGL